MSLLGTYTKDTTDTVAQRHRDIQVFLREHPIAVLATADPNAMPHAATIYFSIDDEFAVYFTTKADTKKSDNLRFNPNAMLVVHDAAQQRSVQITGVVSAVLDPDKVNEVFRGTLRASLHVGHSAVPPIAKVPAGEFVAYCLRPTQIRHATFGPKEVGKKAKLFEVIDL